MPIIKQSTIKLYILFHCTMQCNINESQIQINNNKKEYLVTFQQV